MKKQTVNVTLEGLTPIMFDRYSGDNNTALKTEDKLYFAPDGKSIVMPAVNLMSFLSAQNTVSAPKRVLPSKIYKNVTAAMLSYVTIQPWPAIPFLAKGEQVVFQGFNEQIFVHKSVARLPKGIPNPKERPVLVTPWSLEFKLLVIENKDFSMKMLEEIWREGGIAVGLGTFRGLFGKFEVTTWQIT